MFVEFQSRCLRLLLAGNLILMTQSCTADAANIELSLSLVDDSMEKGLVELQVEMVNDSPSVIRFLPWGTAMESTLNGAAFKVVDVLSGEEIPYAGRMLKRRTPEESDYMAVAIGEKVTNQVIISNSYTFCPNRDYIVSVKPNFFDPEYNLIEVVAPAVNFSTKDAVDRCDS